MRTIGFDIKTVQYGYPIGMPLTRVLHGTGGLEEVRCNISNGIARVIFYVENDTMVLLYGFIKKFQETPKKELDVAIISCSAMPQLKNLFGNFLAKSFVCVEDERSASKTTTFFLSIFHSYKILNIQHQKQCYYLLNILCIFQFFHLDLAIRAKQDIT